MGKVKEIEKGGRSTPAKELETTYWQTVIVIIAHPDDEMAMGGTIAKLTAEGKEVILVVATNGELGINEIQQYPPEELKEIRKREQLAAADILAISEVIFLNYPDQGLEESQNKVREQLENLVLKYNPDALFTWDPQSPYFPLNGQPHPDHAAIGNATIQALTTIGLPTPPVLFLFLPTYEEISHFSKVPPSSPFYEQRRNALAAHFSQMTPHMWQAFQDLGLENLMRPEINDLAESFRAYNDEAI